MIKVFSLEDLYNFFNYKNYDTFAQKISDHKNNLRFFHLDNSFFSHGRKEFFICWVDGEKIIAVLSYVQLKTPNLDGHMHYISYLSVRPSHKNQGLAKTLVQYWLKNCYDPNMGLLGVSGYTEEGFKYLKPVLENLGIAVQIRQKEFQ